MLGTEAIENIMPFGHAANAIELDDGRIFVTWYCASYEGAEDQRIAGALRERDGTWSPTRTVVGRFEFEEDDWIPEIGVPLQGLMGEIRLYFWAVPASGGFKLLYNPCYVRIVGGAGPGAYTHGETIRFETPVFTRDISSSRLFLSSLRPDFVAENVQVFWPERGLTLMGAALRLHSGRWLLPYDTWGQSESQYHSRFLVSDENLENWETRGDVFAKPGCAEPSVVQLPSGDVLCYMRRRGKDGHIWRAGSSNECKSFSGPFQTNLRNPDAGVDISLSGTSGRLLIAYNDSYRQRVPLCVGISADQGQTWRVRDVESDVGNFAYPKLLQSQDGLWHLFYSYDYRHIQHAWFGEDWLEGGRQVVG